MKDLFISMADKNKKGYFAEKKVWDSVKAAFSKRDCFAYWNYPVFNPDYNSRTEPDILVFDKELGITIIEVKGINIGNIDSIQGHQWNYRNYFIEKGNPYQQAEHQMYSLMEWLPNMHEKFTKRVLVALPYISKAEWVEKGFDQLPSNPPIIFKDDLGSGSILDTISATFLSLSKESLKEEDWRNCHSLLSGFVNKEGEKEYKDQPKYSLLYIPSSSEDIKNNIAYFESLLQKGIKVTILSLFERRREWFRSEIYGLSEKAFIFQFILADNSFSIENPVILKDGEGLDEQFKEKWLTHFPRFNKEQYSIEHAGIEENLMIEAGAGTGKTMVMVQRIFFLLAMVPDLSLKDIVMITFTRESASEMKRRLKKELMVRQSLTKQPIFLQYAEQLKEMNVSTIDSFAKSLLEELGFVLGFGRNVRLTTFKEKRKGIISEVLDDYYKTSNSGNLVIGTGRNTLRHFERIKIIESFWNEMESKGLTETQIKDLVWSTTEENPIVEKTNKLFKYVFHNCERKFDALKKRENAITIGDLVRKISEISNDTPETLKELSKRFKYLFVDEFQDSDDVQIRLVSQLHNIIQVNLFVVGDVKQSIYRFRGADYTAFRKLKSYVLQPFVMESLRINYRTSKSLIAELDKHFSRWNEQKNLTYSERDSLESYVPSTYHKDEFLIEPYYRKKDIQQLLVAKVRNALEKVHSQQPEPEEKKVSILVRTNGQANKVFKWLDEQDIAAEMNVGGTFFASEAVKDFHSLLTALLYPEDARALLNLFATPYFKEQVTVGELISFEGDNERILDHLMTKYHASYHIFKSHVTELRYQPIFAVLRKFTKNDIYQNLYLNKIAVSKKLDENIREKNKFEVEKYRSSLNHLMNIIHSQFDSTKATLYALHKWLGIKIKTDRTEDEPLVHSEKSTRVVEIVTVHKSKGLEYHTVIIPFTDFPFSMDWDEILLDTKRKYAGWSINNINLSNELYKTLKSEEQKEVIKEETRLLYVATTRARERLIILQPNHVNDYTWSALFDE